MEKTKKKSLWRVMVLLVVVALISSWWLTNSFAKYTLTVSSLDAKARVAQFLSEGSLTFTPFDSIYELTNDATVSTTEESHVHPANSDKVIAPGTGGKYDIDVTSTASGSTEVDVTYNLSFEEVSNDGIPIEYSLDNSTWTSDITSLTYQGTTAQTLYWRWVFNAANDTGVADAIDEADTALGVDGTAQVVIKAHASIVQVD